MWSNRFPKKVAIITASTSGIGLAIARRLAQEGAKVVISSRKQEHVDTALETLKSENLDVIGTVCHVSNADHRRQLFAIAEKEGGLDILISNAAVNFELTKKFFDCTESAWDKIFDVNVKSSFLLAQEALPLLRQKPYGRIIFMSSIAALRTFRGADFGAYAVSKSALCSVTKLAAAQLAVDNITVNCIAPGGFNTSFGRFICETEPYRTIALEEIPMRRFGRLEEVSAVAAFLASEEASYITGEVIPVSGGVGCSM